jgi:hypothetical protein
VRLARARQSVHVKENLMLSRSIVVGVVAALAFTATASAQDWKTKYPERRSRWCLRKTPPA